MLFSFACVASADTADLKMTFKFDGDPPESKKVVADKDAAFCGKHDIPNESLVVDPQTKAVKNIVVYVYTGRGGSKLDKDLLEPASNTHTLANDKCRFEPHIVITQAGDKLDVTNPDAVTHNVNLPFFNNDQVNLTIPPGQKVTIDVEDAEPAPIPAACNIHPWMTAKVLVLEHPFGAASNDEGTLTITGLPAGEDLVFRVYHETLSLKELKGLEGADSIELKRSNFEIELEPGMNDLGTFAVGG